MEAFPLAAAFELFSALFDVREGFADSRSCWMSLSESDRPVPS